MTRASPFKSNYWFLWHKGALNGPFSTRRLIRDIAVGRTLWTDGIWNPELGIQKWSRICDVPAFRAAMPPLPDDELIKTENLFEKMRVFQAGSEVEQAQEKIPDSIRELLAPLASKGKAAVSAVVQKLAGASSAAPATLDPNQIWFMEFEGQEYGPLTARELLTILRSGKLKGSVFVSKDGMQSWLAVEEVRELDPSNPISAKSLSESAHESLNRRKHSRVPLIAEVLFSSGDGRGDPMTYSGICRDISARGMLILTQRCPTSIGVKVKLEVIPLESQGLGNFTAFAEIVRILPEKNGFSTRFDTMQESARQALDKYIHKQAQVLGP